MAYKMKEPFQKRYDSMTEDERLMAFEAGLHMIYTVASYVIPPESTIEELEEKFDYPDSLYLKMGFTQNNINEGRGKKT